MIPLPTKPIESMTAFITGDPSVGIPHASFNLECYLDINTWSVDDMQTELNEIRKRVGEAYELMHGEPCSVMFDYEIAYEQDNTHYN